MRKLDEGLDALPSTGGTVGVDRSGATAEVDVIDVDRLGVRVRSVRVVRERPVDLESEARALPDRVRSLPDRLEPVDVDAGLGGARLRTRPDEYHRREYFEVEVEPLRTTIHRTRVDEEGNRAPSDWTMTREQLDRLIDETTEPSS
jgi:hypothetical protein